MSTFPSSSAHDSTELKRKSASDPGAKIPTRPEDTTASGDAKNDTGEDNQQEKQ